VIDVTGRRNDVRRHRASREPPAIPASAALWRLAEANRHRNRAAGSYGFADLEDRNNRQCSKRLEALSRRAFISPNALTL